LFHLLPKDLNEDEFGNLFIKIGGDVMFTSHLDTATKATVNHVFDGKTKTDGKSILVQMIKQVLQLCYS
jgi:putative aminopeptidase FrvX